MISNINTLLYSLPFNEHISHKLNKGKPESISITDIFNRIKNNPEIDKINAVREEFLLNGKSKLYESKKANLSFTLPNISALYNPSLRNTEVNISQLSNLMYLELDFFDKNKRNIFDSIYKNDLFKSELSKNSNIFSLWKSVSNSGLGILVKCSGLTINNFQYYQVKIANKIRNDHKALFEKYNIHFGTEVNKATQPNFISYDQEIYINENSIIQLCQSGRTHKNEVILEFNPSIDVSNKNYYSETRIDKHYPQLMEEVNYQVTYQGNGVWFSPYGLKHVKLFGRKSKVKIGQRNSTLIKDLSICYYLNRHWSKARLFNWIKRRNEILCLEPLKQDELLRIVNYIILEFNPDKIPFKLKHTWFDSTCRLSKEEKISIANKNRKWIKKTQVSLQYLKKESRYCTESCVFLKRKISELMVDGFIINQKLLSKASGIAFRTVQYHWKTFKEEIKQHNLNIRMNKKIKKQQEMKLIIKKEVISDNLTLVKPIINYIPLEIDLNGINYTMQLMYAKTG